MYSNKDEEYKFQISIPRWILWILVAMTGFGCGVGFGHLVVKADESRAYEAGRRTGYEEGQAANCDSSRVMKAAEWMLGTKDKR